MKQRIFGLISALIGIVIALAAIELTAIVWLYLEEGRYVSAEELFQRTQNTYVRDLTKGTSCRYVDTLYPHPYLAFVHHGNPPCGLPNVNNIGLLNTDFPTIKRDESTPCWWSAAGRLAGDAEHPATRAALPRGGAQQALCQPQRQAVAGAERRRRRVEGAAAFILFAMYATSVDAVIALDGYNEHYMFRPYTEARLEAPLSNFTDVNPFVADENFGDAAIGWVMGRVAGSLAQMPLLGHSHAAYMIVRGIEAVAKGKDVFKADKNKKTTLTSIFALPSDVKGNGEKVFQTQLALYQKYERAIEAVAKENNVKTAYFMQPVPSWGKTLTAEEVRAAGANMTDPVIYRRMVDGMMTLRDQGLQIFDLGDLLKDVKETIYADDIHFTRDTKGDSKGYRLMATKVVDDLAKAWNLQPKSGN